MAFTQLASDNFQRANSDPLGGNWTPESTNATDGYCANQIISDLVYASDDNLIGNSYYNDVIWPNDQYSEVTLASIASSAGYGGVGVDLRMGATGAETSYDLYVLVLDPSTYAGIIQVTDGATSNILVENGVTGSLTAGDVIRGEAIGSTLNLYHNGVLIAAATDSTYTGGNVGIYLYGFMVADASISSWSGGGNSPSPSTATSYAMLDRVEGRGVTAPVILAGAFYNPFKQDILQVAQPGGRVVWNLSSSGVATTNPSSPTKGTMLGPYYGSTFADAWTNKNNLDIFQVVNAGGKVIFHVNSLGIASTP